MKNQQDKKIHVEDEGLNFGVSSHFEKKNLNIGEENFEFDGSSNKVKERIIEMQDLKGPYSQVP
jgi:hypothetical protein